MNRTSLILSVLLTAFTIYLVYVFVEYYEEEQDLGWTQAAIRNPFLAAELYTEKMGVEVASFDSFLKIENLYDYDTLFLAETGQIISEKRLEELLDWIDQGGHLIVAAQRVIPEDSDRLFQAFDLSSYRTDYEGSVFDSPLFDLDDNALQPDDDEDSSQEDGKDEPKVSDTLRKINEELRKQGLVADDETEVSFEEQVANYEQRVDEEELSQIEFTGIDGVLMVRFKPSIALDHPAFSEEYWQNDSYEPIYWRGSHYGTHLLQLERGSGMLTVLSDSELFRSDHIIYFDHTYLWDSIVGTGSVAILYGSNMPSLWFMLRSFMPETLIAFAGFIFAWIWFQRQRFGPVHVPVLTVRRSSAEHIFASASFSWRGAWQQQLLEPVRKEIHQQAEKRLYQYDQAEPEEQIQLLAARCEVEPAYVADAMQSDKKHNEDSFYRTVRLLQKIRESL